MSKYTIEQKRQILCYSDAVCQDFKLRDIYELHMDGLKGWKDMTPEYVEEQWAEYFPDGDEDDYLLCLLPDALQ